MPRFTFDFKAVSSITVKAPTEEQARDAVHEYVNCSLVPEPEEIDAWNAAKAEELSEATIESFGGWTIEGELDLDEAE